MKFIIFPTVTIMLLTISVVTSQNTCGGIQYSIQAYMEANTLAVATALATEKKAADASNANISAIEKKIADDAKNVTDSGTATFNAVQSASYISALRSAEATRATIATSQATANALAFAKVIAVLNAGVADCATIAAMQTRSDSCGSTAINATIAEIAANVDTVLTIALTEQLASQAGAAEIADLKRSVNTKVKDTLGDNYHFNINSYPNTTAINMAAQIAKQAALSAFTAVQASLMISGIQYSENFRKTIKDANAEAFAIAEAKYLVALRSALVACDAIAALPKFANGSCAYNATLAIAKHIKESSDSVIAVASTEKDLAIAAADLIAFDGVMAENIVKAAYVTNNGLADDAYLNLTPAETASILVDQAAVRASNAVNSAVIRAAKIAIESARAVAAAATAAAKAVAVALKLADLNGVLAAC